MREFRTHIEQTGRSAPDGRPLERISFTGDLNARSIGGDGHGWGYLSVFGNEDSYGDVVDPGAYTKTLAGRKDPLPLLWQHDSADPIGVYTKLAEDDYGLYTEFQLDLNVQRGREAYSLAKMGAVKGQSIGFTTLQEDQAGGLRHLKELKLWEGSLVTFPANELAQISGVRAAGQDAALLDLLREIRALLEQRWDGSASRYTDEEWAAACILDRGSDAGMAKARYGLPIADPGKPYTDPNAGGVHAAAARISQAKAPADAIHTAYVRLKAAYKKLGEPVPDSVSEGAKAEAGPQAAAAQALLDAIRGALALREPRSNPEPDKTTRDWQAAQEMAAEVNAYLSGRS